MFFFLCFLFPIADSYEKALNYAKKKSNTDTETSCFELGKSKRKKKRKSQDVHSDSSDSPRMTPPPSITIQHLRTSKIY